MKTYEIYEEAQAAIQQLDPVPTIMNEHRKVISQDPLLISTPDRKYKNNGWNNWEEYLGQEKKDPRLTSTPQKKYKNNGWNGWEEYLGKEKRPLR